MQLDQIRRSVLAFADEEAACLSEDEHELVERALILGGCIPLGDCREIAAAQALSLRLWANIGMISGKPFLELDAAVAAAAENSFAASRHQRIRAMLSREYARLQRMLYLCGAMDDRRPQMMIADAMARAGVDREHARYLSRCYIWAGFDCVDYSGGVMLLHEALADPRNLLADGRRKTSRLAFDAEHSMLCEDILPEEMPLQRALERSIEGALREGRHPSETARELLYLCKQGAPLTAMEDVLQSMLIVYRTDAMRAALGNMYHGVPKWIECTGEYGLQ